VSGTAGHPFAASIEKGVVFVLCIPTDFSSRKKPATELAELLS
jgi:hypothetical protein